MIRHPDMKARFQRRDALNFLIDMIEMYDLFNDQSQLIDYHILSIQVRIF